MPLKIKCPTCKRVLSVPVQRIGEIVRCPVCEKKLRVPKPQHSKTEDSEGSEKRPKTQQGQSRPATRSSNPSPPPKGPPRVKREPARAPKAKHRPDAPAKPSAKKLPIEKRPPAPPEPPSAASETAPSERESSKKQPQGREPSDPPKPPPLSKSKRRHREATPGSSPAEFRSQEREPKQKEAKAEADESAVKAEPKKQRWKKEQDGHLSSDRPPLPEKAAQQKKARDDSRSDARLEPPRLPPRSPREDNSAETAGTETQGPDREVIRGYEHDIHRCRTVYYLGIALISAALFGAIPAVMDIVENFRAIDPPGISRWAFALLFASAIQLAYAVYLVQLPDWSTAWVVSLVTLVMATGYAMFLGIAILAKEDSQIIQLLELADKVYGRKAAGWCLIMLSISSLLAYFSGRISVRWHHAYDLATRSATEY